VNVQTLRYYTEISELIEVGSHRGPRPGLRDAAAAKLAEVEAKITQDLHTRRAERCVELAARLSELVQPLPGARTAAG
jgi:MerR family transcriptional regulator, mercuric resistance operon regulatory protein